MAHFRLSVGKDRGTITVEVNIHELPLLFADLEALLRQTRKDRFGYRAWRKSGMSLERTLRDASTPIPPTPEDDEDGPAAAAVPARPKP